MFKVTLKVALLHGCFSCFLYCANGNKSRKATQILVYLMNISNIFVLMELVPGPP